MLLRMGHPYAAEVVGDPYDTFAPGAVRHPLRPLFRWWFARQLRRHCRQAFAAAYVTAAALQRRYPPGPTTHTTDYSSVELPPSALLDRQRADCTANGRPRTLVMVGTLAQLYKAPDVLVDAVARCVRRGLDVRLVFVGDGRYRRELEAQAARQGLAGRVDFLGQLPAGEGVARVLDRADVFVLPSRQEGLPRALLEAMARGLPCISSTVGGIPEVLPAEDMVPPGDVEALALKIQEVVTDPARMVRMSVRNLKTARGYREDVLQRRRRAFYEYVRAQTQARLDRQGEEADRPSPATAAAGTPALRVQVGASS
jgi:glycosyltransferase involved in cell wall biosynthesis